uniref:Uncharacterized protein n=1 Tax=Phenylobacterium glaciei TaxID=2803784 RepID=A0A974SA24_9CAUL|nr:hypothetical protein JKL49_09530 [Phenylobacterium glaciei]
MKDDPPIGLRTAPGDTLSAWAKPVNPLPPAVALNRLIDGSLEVKITPRPGLGRWPSTSAPPAS